MFDGFEIPRDEPEWGVPVTAPASPKRGFRVALAHVLGTLLALVWVVGVTLLMLVATANVLMQFLD